VVYREGECTMVLMDEYDIVNKALLCNPSFDVHSLDFFKNPYDRLRVLDDDRMDAVTDKESLTVLTNSPSLSPVTMEPTPSVSPQPSLSLSAYSTHSLGSTVYSPGSPALTPCVPQQVPVLVPVQVPVQSLVHIPAHYAAQISKGIQVNVMNQVPVNPVLLAPPMVPLPSPMITGQPVSGEMAMQWTNDVMHAALQNKAHFDSVFMYNTCFGKCRGQ